MHFMIRIWLCSIPPSQKGTSEGGRVRCRGARRTLGRTSGTGAALFWGIVLMSKQVFSFLDFPLLSFISLSLSVWPIYKCWFAEGLTVTPERPLPPVASWCLCTCCPTNGHDTHSSYLTSGLPITALFSIPLHASNLLGSFY